LAAGGFTGCAADVAGAVLDAEAPLAEGWAGVVAAVRDGEELAADRGGSVTDLRFVAGFLVAVGAVGATGVVAVLEAAAVAGGVAGAAVAAAGRGWVAAAGAVVEVRG
jgi:hypothetical protein